MLDLSHMNEARSFCPVPKQNEFFLENFYDEDFRGPQKRGTQGIYADEARCKEHALVLSE
jgi:hypothetical protein